MSEGSIAPTPAQLILLGRPWCSLCDEMQRRVTALHSAYPLQLTVFDLDDYPSLVDRYDERMPVLFGLRTDAVPSHFNFDDSVEICVTVFDRNACIRWFQSRTHPTRACP
jgi:hypothetical protein